MNVIGQWLRQRDISKCLQKQQEINKERIEFYDFENTEDPYVCGFIPSEKEWIIERPDYQKDEHICIVAINSLDQFLRVSLFKSKQVNGKVNLKLYLLLKINKKEEYSIEEHYVLPISVFKPNEYKAGALSIEVLNPFRKLRIKFRGYLKNGNTGEVIFANLRLHWYSLSNVYDHKCSFDSNYIAKQLVKNGSKVIETEDRIEQFGNIKGTVQFEKSVQQQLFLWGLRSKNICEKGLSASRLIGIAKNGIAFDIGFVSNDQLHYSYSYGLTKNAKGILESATQSQNEMLSFANNSCEIIMKTSKNAFVVKLESGSKDVRNATIDGMETKCISVNDDYNSFFDNLNENQLNIAYNCCDVQKVTTHLVLPVTDKRAQNVQVSGGKGASLVALTQLSEVSDRFKVPNGIIITSNAYNLLLQENSEVLNEIKKLENLTWTRCEQLKSVCLKIQELISGLNIPNKVKEEMERHLNDIFGDSFATKQFAVRSSAVGEDSEEMSGAGQLTTYLGVKGMDEILKAVMKCWASQFNYNYTEYKRGYGQLINNAMAVVVIEMVDCDTAGVIFTCDPLNGDERTVVISANYGLGESVVSASSEPDTIRLKIGIQNNDLNVKRTVEGIEIIDIGKKAKFIKMNENGGTVELDVQKNDVCCVSNDDLLKLAEVALNIHAYYGNTRDIEWGLKEGIIYILQSRPVTNLDSYSEWEIMHDLDSGFQQERGYFSRLHWNENFPGATSPLGLSFTVKLLDSTFQKFLTQMSDQRYRNLSNYCPYIFRPLATYYSQVFFNFREFAANISKEKNDNRAYIGKDILSDDIKDELKTTGHSKIGFFAKIIMLIKLLFAVIFSGRLVCKTESKLKNVNWFPNKESQTPKELFSEITRGACETFLNVARVHSIVTMTAGIFTKFILNILTSSTKDENEALSDFAKIQEANSKIASAQVPKLFQGIANAIDDKTAFSDMTDEEALNYLINGSHKASILFKNFLKKHGYRGMREMDPYVMQWGDEPIKLIPMLKNASQKLKEVNTKIVTVAELLSSLKTRPSFIKRLLLRVFIPLSFRGTRLREHSKSLLVYFISKYRTAFYCLAHKLSVEEGKLPEKELLFFLTLSEIEQLIKSRNATLVEKAKHRKRIRSKLDKLQFPQIVRDWQLTPVNVEKRIDVSKIEGAVSVQGTAVTSLIIKGRACVAPSLDDAKDMKNGDILITYTTDIGWSPYFPIVSGVVTEMGGLNSHGAVIAREFGLPCIVGAENACEMFKTGDTVLIDGEKGIVMKIDEKVDS